MHHRYTACTTMAAAPELNVTAKERAAGALGDETLDRIVSSVRERGYVVLGPVIGALLAVAHFKAMTKAAPEVPPEDMAKIELPSRDEEA